VHETAIRKLEERYNGTADFATLSFSIFPTPRLVGRQLVIRHEGRTDIPPVITIERLHARFTPWGLLADPMRIDSVSLEGLEIQISRGKSGGSVPGADGSPPRRPHVESARDYPFLIDEIVADGTVLKIIPARPDKEPLVFDIQELHLQSIGRDRPMAFDAQLVNAKPPGLISTTGHFGPWNGADPGGTPVEGEYQFDEADLSVFNGISGSLSSSGNFSGHLSRIEADGFTDTPNFQVGDGQPVHLVTSFHAVIDGTAGDTLLQPVQARFLETLVTARGGVVEEEKGEGKTISLDVTIDEGTVEDLIALVLGPETPPVTGRIKVKTDFRLPTGEEEVIDRLLLEGEFSLVSAMFGSGEAQSKVDELSWRARGRPDEDEDPIDRVVSNLNSRFAMQDAVIRFNRLTFEVPGAQVLLDGSHDVRLQTLDFKGKLRMKATVSEAVGGFKSIFLKVVDPFFKKDGAGAEVSIKVEGTIEEPKMGLDF
jgi:hypothetical protein